MMYEGKHIHFSPVDNRPLCSYSGKLCRQRRVNNYAFCIRHILEDKAAPFKQCAHVAKYNNQKCTNPIPANEDREFCNSHMQVAGMAPKKERKNKKEKEQVGPVADGKLKFAERVKVLCRTEDLSPDDLDNADDPYAFSDPATLSIKETRHHLPSTVGMCNKMVDNRPTALESVVQIESGKSNCQSSVDGKHKDNGGSIKSSKSVNRLEARIARNKILYKLKKGRSSVATDGSPCTRLDFSSVESEDPLVEETISSVINGALEAPCPIPSSAGGKTTPLAISPGVGGGRSLATSLEDRMSLPADLDKRVSDCDPNVRTSVTIYPRKCPKKRVWRKPTLISSSVKQLQRLWEDRGALGADLFPLGLDGSDSDSEPSDVEIYQRHWFASPSDQDSWDDGKNGVLLRSIKQNFAKSDFRRQCVQMRSSQNNSATSRNATSMLARALIKASKCQPTCTARLLGAISQKPSQQDAKKKLKSVGLSKQKCCYSNEVSECSAMALPYTRHCIKHIMYNVDQLLFEHCTAKFADNTQCCIPVFDICHELPLCVEHARKRDNYSKMSAEPKPKKPRKKTKPSALTRPPKRGKKKKRQVSLRLADVTNLSHESSTSQDLLPSAHFITSSPSINHNSSVLHVDDVRSDLDGQMEGDLGSDLVNQLSPGTIDKSLDLPMDAVELANQASRLLEEHDFTEVLSKIPDEAFTELFNESKNGDLCHSKEAEELVRALASVDKDVKFSHEDQMELNEALLHGDHLGVSMDHTLSDLVSASGLGLDSLHVITSSLSTSDLNSISQVLSSITGAEGTLAHLPLLSDLVSSTSHHLPSDMMAGGGFSLRHDGVSALDQFGSSLSVGLDPSDSLVATHAQWFNDQYSMVHPSSVHQNGLSSPSVGGCGHISPTHSSSSAPSKYISHSLSGISKLDGGSVTTKGYHHHHHLSGGAFLENSHLNLGSMAPMIMELPENPAESVS